MLIRPAHYVVCTTAFSLLFHRALAQLQRKPTRQGYPQQQGEVFERSLHRALGYNQEECCVWVCPEAPQPPTYPQYPPYGKGGGYKEKSAKKEKGHKAGKSKAKYDYHRTLTEQEKRQLGGWGGYYPPQGGYPNYQYNYGYGNGYGNGYGYNGCTWDCSACYGK